ncbi:MAG: UDP-N-acetylmuramoyl-L-alanyl-D-glutamate--2,6-diaminopimelate ligase [Firmicutes bacterium]|nr:UDP-N-acetylmuramoyl-L-alanyl-D-glutamate--2,6-diaminopimelate ligase [Bacillota bacterium]
MRLSHLLKLIPTARIEGPGSLDVTALSYDSRQVTPGSLFVAIRGLVTDGHLFVDDAISAGAAAVMVERDVPVPEGVVKVVVPDSREALAMAAATLYGHPSKKLRLIGVTGTNGKTTTTYLIRSILRAQGFKVGLIGTVKALIDDEEIPAGRTTPESLDLQALLARMVRAGCDYAVMEVSSHALDLKRVASCEFDAGVFTNLTQDHLDYHGTLEEYLAAKARLFRMLGTTYAGHPKRGPKVAVLNLDDPASAKLRALTRVPVMTYGIDQTADLTASRLEVDLAGVRYDLDSPRGQAHVSLAMSGRFNAYNSLAALGVGLAEGVPLEVGIRALEGVAGVPGRVEAITGGQPFSVLVDYAHTPDGLENVLRAAREMTRSRVLVVFGAGGDRDRTKRPIMGRIAGELADLAFITSDNPRSEDPGAIAEEIRAGLAALPEHAPYKVQVDRAAAIERAVEAAEPGDVVVIAGKGHETYQIFRDRTIHFDDREVAAAAVRRRMGK